MSLGDDYIVAGFILSKLYMGYYFVTKSGHGRHTEVDNMPKGYPPKYHGQFKKAISDLRKQGLVVVFKSTGSEHIGATLSKETVERGLKLCNAYRKLVELPPLDKEFKELEELEESTK